MQLKDDDESLKYVISKFIINASERDQQSFEFILDVAKGAMLATVFGKFDETTPTPQIEIPDLTVFLDTPVLLDSLGYHGHNAEQAMEEVLKLARDSNIKISIFRHSLKECVGILENVKESLDYPCDKYSSRPAYRHFYETSATKSELLHLIQNIETSIQNLGIRIIDKPANYSDNLDENALETQLANKIRYHLNSARLNDVDSISAVYRYRRQQDSNSFVKARAILISSNKKLVEVAKKFGSELERYSFPLALTVENFASHLWVRTSALSSDVPQKILIANAYAGMNPSEELWVKYIDYVEKLKENSNFDSSMASILKVASLVNPVLMNVTQGDENNLTNESVTKIAHEVMESYQILQDKTLADLVDDHEVLTHKLSRKHDENERTIADLEASRGELAKAKIENDALKKKVAETDNLKNELARIKTRTKWGIFLLIFIAFIVLFVYFTWRMPELIAKGNFSETGG